MSHHPNPLNKANRFEYHFGISIQKNQKKKLMILIMNEIFYHSFFVLNLKYSPYDITYY